MNKTYKIKSGGISEIQRDFEGCYLNAMSNSVVLKCHYQVASEVNYATCIAELVTFKNSSEFIFESNEFDAYIDKLSFIYSSFPEIPSTIFVRLNSLRILELNSVNLKMIKPILKCGNLEVFKAAFNETTTIESESFENCVNLTTIDLSFNQILTLGDAFLHKLTVLENLFFNDNKISKITRPMFQQFASLKRLNLANNEIDVVQRGALDRVAEFYEEVDFAGNICINKTYSKFVRPDQTKGK